MSKMNLGPDVDLEDCRLSAFQYDSGDLLSVIDVSRPDKLASAQIASICQAAGLQGE
jgi:hypothetical protein